MKKNFIKSVTCLSLIGFALVLVTPAQARRAQNASNIVNLMPTPKPPVSGM